MQKDVGTPFTPHYTRWSYYFGYDKKWFHIRNTKSKSEKSNNVWLCALMQSDCLYSSLFFEH